MSKQVPSNTAQLPSVMAVGTYINRKPYISQQRHNKTSEGNCQVTWQKPGLKKLHIKRMKQKNEKTHNASRESNFLMINGLNLHYEIQGAGDPLLLLHGGTTDNNVLRSYMDKFSECYTVLAPEQQAHGQTKDIERDFNFRFWMADTKGLLESLDLHKVNIVGWSDGGTLGLHLAATYPELVRKLIIIGARYNSSGFSDEITNFIHTSFENQYRSKFIRLWFQTPMLTRDDIQKIEAATLIISGDRDVIRLEHTLDMYRNIKNSHLYILPNADHFLLKAKEDCVLPQIVSFLQEG